MNIKFKVQQGKTNKQQGASLMEVLIAMSISLVVTAAMIALMANSLGTTTRIIKMTKLSDDMRIAMQMMSRDIRRSNYNGKSMYCYATESCLESSTITLADGSEMKLANDTLVKPDPDADDSERVGVIEMWTGNAAPACGAAAGTGGWVQITNPENMDIFEFSVDENLSYTQEIFNDGATSLSQKVRKIRMNMQGQLVLDNTIVRRMEDVISVRNDLLQVL